MRIILTILFITFFSFSAMPQINKIIFFDKGKATGFIPNPADSKELFSSLKNITYGIYTEMVLVSDSAFISSLQKKGKSFEIFLDTISIFPAVNGGSFAYSKILFSLTGITKPDKVKKTIPVIIGINEYDASPYISSGTFNDYLNLEKRVLSLLKKTKKGK